VEITLKRERLYRKISVILGIFAIGLSVFIVSGVTAQIIAGGLSDSKVVGQGISDNFVVNQVSGSAVLVNSSGLTTTTTSTTTTTITTSTSQAPLIPQSTGSLIVKYLLPLAIILVTIFMVFRYWKNPIMLICYFIGLMLMLILALNFTNLL
jgi:hypothetical protein